MNENDKEDIKEADYEFFNDNKDLVKERPKKRSPLKNPDKKKSLMKTINIKPTEWAENFEDNNFLVMGRRIMNKRSKIINNLISFKIIFINLIPKIFII